MTINKETTLYVVSRDDVVFGIFLTYNDAKKEQKNQEYHRGMRGSMDTRIYISKTNLK